jgi:hypothetical protein
MDDELESLEGLHAGTHDLLDMVDVYRSACRARDYPDSTIEYLTVQYHQVLMNAFDRALAEKRVADLVMSIVERATATKEAA